MTKFVQKSDSDFLVDIVIGVWLVPAAREFDDALTKEVYLLGNGILVKPPPPFGVVNRAIGDTDPGVQSAQVSGVVAGCKDAVGDEFLHHFGSRQVKHDDGDVFNQILKARREREETILQQCIEATLKVRSHAGKVRAFGFVERAWCRRAPG